MSRDRPCTQPAKCRSCGSPILWAKTVKKMMPLDPDPVPDGKYVLRHRASENTLYADVWQAEYHSDPKWKRRRCHFDGCKNGLRKPGRRDGR